MGIENKQVDFSVIVCCYNSDFEKEISTIISICNQKNVSFEIIVSDDGSKNNHKDELVKWAKDNNLDKKIIYNFLPQNVGTVRNIISSVKIANGKYIKTISPGDYLLDPFVLEKMKKELESSKTDLVYGDTIYYNENGIVEQHNISHNKLIYKRNIKNIFCLYGGYFMGSAFIATKETYEKFLYPFDGIVKLMEDRALMYLGFVNGIKLAYIKEPVLWYEYGNGVSTSGSNPQLEEDFNKTYEFLTNQYPNNRLVQKMLLKEKYKNKNSLLKAIVFLFNIPGIYAYKFRLLFSKELTNNVMFEDIRKAITLGNE